MRIIYETGLHTHICNLIRESIKSKRKIKKVLLNEEEYREVEIEVLSDLKDLSKLSEYRSNFKCFTYLGVSIERETAI